MVNSWEQNTEAGKIYGSWYGKSEQNIFIYNKRQATIVFPKDVERTVHVVMPAFFIKKNNFSHVCIKRT